MFPVVDGTSKCQEETSNSENPLYKRAELVGSEDLNGKLKARPAGPQ